jgi:predicted DNA-binding transcriptional regulator AlpA
VSKKISATSNSTSLKLDRQYLTDRPLSVKEAAAFLGLHPRTLDNWRSQKRGPRFRRVGRRKVVYLVADLREYLDSGIVEGDR